MNEEEDALPCPHCGADAWVSNIGGYEVGCKKCGTLGPSVHDCSREGAIEAWNKRAPINQRDQ